MHSEQMDSFLRAVFSLEGDQKASSGQKEALLRAFDEAFLLDVLESDSAQLAYGEAARLYDYQPVYEQDEQGARGSAAIALPLAIAAQRLLGDVSGKRVVLPNIWNGALAAFLPKDAQITAYQFQSAAHVSMVPGLRKEGATAIEISREPFTVLAMSAADAMIFNADPRLDELGQREDYRLALSSLRHMPSGSKGGDDFFCR